MWSPTNENNRGIRHQLWGTFFLGRGNLLLIQNGRTKIIECRKLSALPNQGGRNWVQTGWVWRHIWLRLQGPLCLHWPTWHQVKRPWYQALHRLGLASRLNSSNHTWTQRCLVSAAFRSCFQRGRMATYCLDNCPTDLTEPPPSQDDILNMVQVFSQRIKPLSCPRL